MKIALVHDYIKEYGGAERVLEALHELYPEAPVYTLVYCPIFLGPHKQRFKQWHVKTSVLQYVPFKHKLISPFRLLAPIVFKTFDFSGYDVVIVSATGAYTPNVIRTQSPVKNHTPDAISHKPFHICYCHTPPRYLYGYATARNWKNNPFLRVCGEIANHFLRIVDYNSSRNVDLFIANSENVAKRIEKFYRKDAVVVYPPAVSVTSDERLVTRKKLNASLLDARRYYITGGRLARAKHYDLIIKACAELNVPLKIFGKGFAGYEEELKEMSNVKYQMSNIQFVGEVSDQEKLKLMSSAKAFIFAGEDEDFGIVPVEAMSVGTPVIGYKSGGVLETVVDGTTGVFFENLTVESLKNAIKKLEKLHVKSQECIKQAEKFSEKQFKDEIKKLVNDIRRFDTKILSKEL